MQDSPYEDDDVFISVQQNPHPDRFEISFKPDQNAVFVKRVDCEGGWGQYLRLELTDRRTGRERVLNIGPSKTNTASFCLAPNKHVPKVIRLCYRSKTIPEFVFEDLSRLNPGYELHLSDDADCHQFIGDSFGGEYADCFSSIPNGSIRADFWRVAVIYKLGGIYFDIDVEHRLGVEDYLLPDTTFLTSTSATRNMMNPIVLMSRPENPVLEACIEAYVERFRKNMPFNYWGWSVCPTMFRAFRYFMGEGIPNSQSGPTSHGDDVYQFLNEDKSHRTRKGYFTHWRGMRVLNNHHDKYLETASFKGFKVKQDSFENDNYRIEVVDHPHPDTFRISLSNGFLTLTRTDRNTGWGQNVALKIHKKSTGDKGVLEVGPSLSNSKIVDFTD